VKENIPAVRRVFVLLVSLFALIGCGKQSGIGSTGPSVPAILFFSAAPGAIMPHGTSVLSWNVSGATGLAIDNGVGVVTGTSQSVSPTATTTYVLTATNNLGSATATATVTVVGTTGSGSSGSGGPTGAGGGTGAGGSTTMSGGGTGGSGSGGGGSGGNGSGTGGSTGTGGAGGGLPRATYPVRVSSNGRYLVDQNGTPFKIHGDAAWSMIANLTAAEMDVYLADRKARGFNTVLVNLIEAKFAVNAPRNRAGDYPFTSHTAGSYDFSTPNETYFALADAAIDKAAASGIAIMLDVMYTGSGGGPEGWWSELSNATNTRAKCNAYGQFLGNRWKGKSNIIWVFSGDFTPPGGSEGEARLLQIYQGIRSAGATQIATAHTQGGATSTVWTAFVPNLAINGVYWEDGGGIQTGSRDAYARKPVLPVFLFESGYEAEQWTPGDPASIRGYEWWAQLSGIAGVFYGHRDIWEFSTDSWSSGFNFGSQRWQLSLDTPGSNAMRHMASLLGSLPWYNLVPSGLDGMKTLVTAGGSTAGKGDYVAAAATPDGKVLVAYLPAGGAANRSITIDMTALSGTASARWFDPTNGTSTDIGGGIANTGTHAFTVPRANASGATDWVLVVTTP
jgi:hypothetical protein